MLRKFLKAIGGFVFGLLPDSWARAIGGGLSQKGLDNE